MSEGFHLDKDGVPIPDDFDPREIEWGYDDSRRKEYPNIEEQLDKLWHDINDGKLDKTGKFYLAIKEIKDKYAKGSTRKPFKDS